MKMCIIVSMEYRKLQSTGGSSLTVTLPKNWVQQTQLQARDRVYTRISGSRLIMTPERIHQKPSSITISCNNETNVSHIKRELIAAFVSGSDTIILKTSASTFTNKQTELLHKTMTYLFGFEIIDSDATSFTIKNILDRSKLSTLDTTAKMASITKNMFDDAIKTLYEPSEDLSAAVVQRDSEVDTLHHMLRRHFNRVMRGILYDALTDVNYCRSVSIQLERIADHAVIVAQCANKENTAHVEPFKQTIHTLSELLEDVKTIVVEQRMDLAHAILDKCQDLKVKMNKTEISNKPHDCTIIHNSLDRTRSYIGNIAEFTIDSHYTHQLGE